MFCALGRNLVLLVMVAPFALAYLREAGSTERQPLEGAYRATAPGVAADSPLLAPGGEVTVCSGGPRSVVVIAEHQLALAVREELTRFETDICDDGYAVIELRDDFAAPTELRSRLAQIHSRPGVGLAGALLIGDIPHAYQWIEFRPTNPAIPATTQEVISLQYYADLDGVFSRSAGYVSPGGHTHSFDEHTGAIDWEIWVGVLPLHDDSREKTAESLRRYFTRNHVYRATAPAFARPFLEINEHFSPANQSESDAMLSGLLTGQYAWTPLSALPAARVYFDSPFAGISVAAGYASLAAGGADLTVVDAHGFWGASGQLSIADVESDPVHTTFFWSNGCAVGDIDRPANFLTSIVYSATSSVLAAKGTTNDSGGMGTNATGFFGHNVATAMAAGASLGDAVLSHVNVPLAWPWSLSREFHYATPIIVGDPTLRLPSQQR